VPLPEVHRRICDWLLEQARRELNERERISLDERERIGLFRAMLN
jgi:hypothetical protein